MQKAAEVILAIRTRTKYNLFKMTFLEPIL